MLTPGSLQKSRIAGRNASYLSRRHFLRYTGGPLACMIALDACQKNENADMNSAVDLGAGDTGILNYAYVIEQLEAAFYDAVLSSPYAGISADETAWFTDIRDHEIAHREFLKNTLADKAIRSLEMDFSSIDFGSRESVLGAAKAFEDLGVSAYNGAGKLIEDIGHLLMVAKIVSVEARHAALMHDLIIEGTFADSSVVGADGIEKSRMPSEVLEIATTYITTPLNTSHLPTS